MKRMHINVGVEDLEQSIKFYNVLFGAEPLKMESDYAKWMLEDPRVSFAISSRTSTIGVDHLGLQVENDSELEELRERLREADMTLYDEGEAVCCYARSDKSWLKDPSGIAWEAYKTMEDVQLFSSPNSTSENSCCALTTESDCCAISA